MHNINTFIEHLSQHPGVYQMLGANGEVLYIGKAKNLKKRIASYFRGHNKDIKTELLVRQIKDIDITITNTESEAVLLECNLIKKHHPRYNVLLRDDKSYPYILITVAHQYPRIDIYRGPRKKNGLFFGPYPSASSVRETISLLQKLFRIRTCSDSFFSARTRPCLLYQIDRCTGPCVGLITPENYDENVELAKKFLEGKSHEVIEILQQKMEISSQQLKYEIASRYRDQISRLRQIQDRQYVSVSHGNADIIGLALHAEIVCIQLLSIRGGQVLGSRSYFPSVPLHSEKEEIITAFLTQHYFNFPSLTEHIPKQIILDVEVKDKTLLENALSEQAKYKVSILYPMRGEKKKLMTMANTSAKESLTAHLFTKTNIYERLSALQSALQLNDVPTRIECFDISHSMGEATVGSCVVFDQNGPRKSDYRRFNIKSVTAGDDIAAMRQTLMRRFKRLQKEEAHLPELILIDGGVTQLAIAKAVLEELDIHEVAIAAIAKGPTRKPGFEAIHMPGKPLIRLEQDSKALHLIQQIRDEAHRFAITGHRMRRDKKRRHSILEDIPGIGVKRRRELLRYFGGIQGLAHASLDELMKVPGINRPLAERIFALLHEAAI